MALVVRSAFDFYENYLQKYEDPRVDKFPLISSPLPAIGILLGYLYFVNRLGPFLMQDRKPFDLKNVMIVYNISQIVGNLALLFFAVSHMLAQDLNWSCLLAPWGDTSRSAEIVTMCSYAYFMLKLFDMMETIFFVLRKKTNQITFLHCYHHFGMLFITYCHMKFCSGGGHGVVLGLVNSVVHAVMYTYYLATALNFNVGVFWKRFITQIQLVQFVILIIHNTIPFFIDCSYFKLFNFTLLIQNSFMLALFSDFYVKAYVKKPKKSID